MRLRHAAGQASLELVGLIAIVALVIGALGIGAAKLDLATPVHAAIKRGICVVTGAVCVQEDGLEACKLATRVNAERLSVKATFLELGRGETLQIERMSDGRATVAFVDGLKAGATVGLGVRLGPLGNVGVDAGGGVGFAKGRQWEFPSWPAAERFLADFAHRETLTGEALGALRRICFLCRKPASAKRKPPEPEEQFYDAEQYRKASAGAEALGGRDGLGAGVEIDRAMVLGLSRKRGGKGSKLYLKVEAGIANSLGAVLGSLATARGAAFSAELERDGAGRPVKLKITGAAAINGGIELAGHTTDMTALSGKLRDAVGAGTLAGDRGVAAEVSATLDLRDPANRAAADEFVRSLRPDRWPGLIRAAAGLARRFDKDAVIDIAAHATGTASHGSDVSVSAGGELGAGYERKEDERRLLNAWTLDRGAGSDARLRRREDCTDQAPVAA